ncbi:hypothetical protein KSF_099010 [Reticulibacter mediterranei]|uniref:Uncharacterized protein n=1 Tax=Reticulibacter mediterranei TaxID=2778369 RepID=A0A8J3IWL6_9CHLR|nr:hypothetical protein KSF_099010 [Reticulibacter mediterranei]
MKEYRCPQCKRFKCKNCLKKFAPKGLGRKVQCVCDKFGHDQYSYGLCSFCSKGEHESCNKRVGMCTCMEGWNCGGNH